MSRQTLLRLLAVLTLTLALAVPAYAAPARQQPGHGSLWARALSWLTRVITLSDQGGLMDPNGHH
jgi:hypothetical protein